MWILYDVGMYLLVLGIRISSLWNPKSKAWIQGRKNWKQLLQKFPQKKGRRVWFHVASLGEFEQAKPVIEKLKTNDSSLEIILSFFSSSGYNQKSDYSHASVIYLPPDLPGNASRFLTLVKPDLAVFVKYDLWPGYLKALSENNIPSILISANWTPSNGLNSWSFPLTSRLLKGFNRIFFQRDEHISYFTKKGFSNIEVTGDTRIDRALLLPSEVEGRLPNKIHECGSFDLVAGSTWAPDETLIIAAIRDLSLRAIIAPHDVSPSNILRLTRNLPFPFQLSSQLNRHTFQSQVLIIDSIGLLSVLYSLGDIAYVGGGFGKGIHNTLEPAAHGKPVLFGPRYKKFHEAVDMINQGGAWSASNHEELIKIINDLKMSGKAKEAGNKNYEYLSSHKGSSTIVAEYIMESIP